MFDHAIKSFLKYRTQSGLNSGHYVTDSPGYYNFRIVLYQMRVMHKYAFAMPLPGES